MFLPTFFLQLFLKNILKCGRTHYEKLSQIILFPFLASLHLVIVTWVSAKNIKQDLLVKLRVLLVLSNL